MGVWGGSLPSPHAHSRTNYSYSPEQTTRPPHPSPSSAPHPLVSLLACASVTPPLLFPPRACGSHTQHGFCGGAAQATASDAHLHKPPLSDDTLPKRSSFFEYLFGHSNEGHGPKANDEEQRERDQRVIMQRVSLMFKQKQGSAYHQYVATQLEPSDPH